MDFTGERYVPGAGTSDVQHEHMHRYRIGSKLAAGKRVLDLGSGEGYGAALLSAVAASVTGLDAAQHAVAHAAARYRNAGIEFVVGSAEDPPLPSASYDLITCFELIEHVDDQSAVMASAERLLAPGGVLLLSTPDRATYNASLVQPNEFHVRELDQSELEQLLRPHFDFVLYGQRTVVASQIWRLGASGPGNLDMADDVEIPGDPTYWIAVAGRTGTQLPRLDASIFVEVVQQDSLLSDMHRAQVQLEVYEGHLQRLAAALQAREADPPVQG